MKKELNDITHKYTNGNEKFESILNLQRYTLSRCGLGCEEFDKEQPLLNKLDHTKNGLHFKIPKCSKCSKLGHSSSSCKTSRKTIKVVKMWVPKGTKVPNTIQVTNQNGSKLAWIPIKRN